MSYIIITSEDSKEIMRITRDGIWVDPEVEPTITASQVLDVMDGYIKTLCQSVWNDAIEAAAEKVDHIYHEGFGTQGDTIRGLKK